MIKHTPISYVIPTKSLHNCDIISVHFNQFSCMEICNTLRKHLSILTLHIFLCGSILINIFYAWVKVWIQNFGELRCNLRKCGFWKCYKFKAFAISRFLVIPSSSKDWDHNRCRLFTWYIEIPNDSFLNHASTNVSMCHVYQM